MTKQSNSQPSKLR